MRSTSRHLVDDVRKIFLSIIVAAGAALGLPLAIASDGTKDPFVGRWDLTIKSAENVEQPSWLEIQGSGQGLRAVFVGRWGNARPLPVAEINGGSIRFVSPKTEEDSKTDLVFQGELAGEIMVGKAAGPNGAPWTWTARRAPLLPSPTLIKWGEPQHFFNGTNFEGWKFDNANRSNSWLVVNDCLVNHAAGANLVTTGTFQDFKLHIEVNCPTNANSGIYLRGRYEVQVEDDSLAEPPSHHMGAIYGFLAPQPEPSRRPGDWQTFDITLLGRFVTVMQNGLIIIDHKEIPGITGGALDSHEELPGPIYLQGDHGGIAYRNLILTPLKP